MKQCPGCRTQFADRDTACPLCRRTDAVLLPGTPSDVAAPGQRSASTGTRTAIRRIPPTDPGSTATRPTTGRIASPASPADPRPGTGRITAGPPPAHPTNRIERPGTARIAAVEAAIRPPPPRLPPGVEPRKPEELGWWPSGYRWGGIAMLLMFLPDVILATRVDGAWIFLTRSIFAFILGLLMVFEKEDWAFMARIVVVLFVISDIREVIEITGGLRPGGTVWFPIMHAVMAVHAGMLLTMSYSNPRARFWVVSLCAATAFFLLSILGPMTMARHAEERSLSEFEHIRLEKRDQDIAAFLKDHDVEARVWTAGDGHELQGTTHERAKSIVARLYAKGAIRVMIGGIEEEDDRQTAWRLLVELPTQPERRKVLFNELCLLRPRLPDSLGQQAPKGVEDPYQDARQRYESLSFGGLSD